MSLRSRIAIPFVALLVITMVILGLILTRSTRALSVDQRSDHLADMTRLVAVTLSAGGIAGDPDRFRAEVARLAEAAGARVSVVRADGVTIADSAAAGSPVDLGPSSEIDLALLATPSTAERPVAGDEGRRLVSAAPIGAPPIAAVRLEIDASASGAAVTGIQRGLTVVTLVVGLAAIVIALRLANRIAAPLEDLRRQSRAVAIGRLDARLTPSGPPEIAAAGNSFNAMTAALRRETTERDRARKRLEAVLTTLSDGVVITDAESNVLLLNRAAAALMHVDPAESIGQRFAVISRDHEMMSLLRTALDDGQSRTATIEFGLNRRQVETAVMPVVDAGESLGLIILRDVTELRRLEAIRREFVANVSHELRTPLATIRALVETLEGGAIDDAEAAPRFLGRVIGEVERLTALVDELLDLARIESGRADLRRSVVAPAALVGGAAERIMALAQRALVEVLVEVSPDLRPISVDTAQIERVLLNLAHNAVKYTPPGGTITMTAEERDGSLVIAVRDTGSGIPESELPRLFERFYKADRARRSGGTGLGLAIAKHIVIAHGGTIWAESEPGVGSTFAFSLPERAADAAPAGPWVRAAAP
ncbi:MAG: ATP-binding protein [Thermomicrobiales bacterium]